MPPQSLPGPSPTSTCEWLCHSLKKGRASCPLLSSLFSFPLCLRCTLAPFPYNKPLSRGTVLAWCGLSRCVILTQHWCRNLGITAAIVACPSHHCCLSCHGHHVDFCLAAAGFTDLHYVSFCLLSSPLWASFCHAGYMVGWAHTNHTVSRFLLPDF